jgi:hypothetical protein
MFIYQTFFSLFFSPKFFCKSILFPPWTSTVCPHRIEPGGWATAPQYKVDLAVGYYNLGAIGLGQARRGTRPRHRGSRPVKKGTQRISIRGLGQGQGD